MATEIEAAELLINQACDIKTEDENMTKESAMAKYYASEVAVKVQLMLYRYLAAMDIPKIFR